MLIQKANIDTNTDLKDINDKLNYIKKVLHFHGKHEDNNIHSLLDERSSLDLSDIQAQHDGHDQKFDQLIFVMQDITNEAKLDSKLLLLDKLYLGYRTLFAELIMHLNFEEEVILPELQQLYSDKELRDIEAPIYEEMTAEQLLDMLKILFPSFNAEDKQSFLQDIKTLQPEKFSKIWCELEQYVDSEMYFKFKPT